MLVEDYVGLAQLRSAVLDEGNWVLVTQGLLELGIPNEVVKLLTEIDPDAEMVEARARVDTALREISSNDFVAPVLASRAGADSLVDARASFLDVESLIGERSDQLFLDLISSAGDIGGAGELIAELRVLEAATDARAAVAAQLTTYFSAQFPAPGTPSGTRLLAGQQALYERSMETLNRVAKPTSAAAAAARRAEASAPVREFRDSIERLIESAGITEGINSDFSAAAIMANPDAVVAGFTAGLASTNVHLDLVDGSAADAEATSILLADGASGEARRALAMLATLTLATMLFAGVVGHQIVSPLRRLSQRADELRLTGELSTERPRGAREVRALGTAINEASAHLALAERQARALAHGQLDHSALAERAPGELGRSLQNAVQTLASSLDDREKFRRQLVHEATHDGLTSLPNRKSSIEQLRKAQARVRRTSSALAVMFIDLDGFKAINDTHGHSAGDMVLQTIAQRLAASVRDGDHVGRRGGDEFIVIAEPVADVAEAVRIAERIGSEVRKPILIAEQHVQVSCCIGLAIINDDSNLTADEFIHDADLAVYKAKSLGAGRIEICDAALKAETLRTTELDRAIRNAIKHDELVVHYQPIVEQSTGTTISYEALVRWERPGVGLVPPADFIPFAERSDVIVDIDRWVIDHVVAQLSSAVDDSRDVPVSVNVSAHHFARPECVENILRPLRRYGVDPSQLIIEVTETALLIDIAETAAKLELLRSTGIRIALDDFGTGYTSLAYLRELPVDIIKIDRSFVLDHSAHAFVKLIIDTGHLIGADITAEGIETEGQARTLTELGCDSLQGYHFGRPAPRHVNDRQALRG